MSTGLSYHIAEVFRLFQSNPYIDKWWQQVNTNNIVIINKIRINHNYSVTVTIRFDSIQYSLFSFCYHFINQHNTIITKHCLLLDIRYLLYFTILYITWYLFDIFADLSYLLISISLYNVLFFFELSNIVAKVRYRYHSLLFLIKSR